jgi:hypothetical protein
MQLFLYANSAGFAQTSSVNPSVAFPATTDLCASLSIMMSGENFPVRSFHRYVFAFSCSVNSPVNCTSIQSFPSSRQLALDSMSLLWQYVQGVPFT